MTAAPMYAGDIAISPLLQRSLEGLRSQKGVMDLLPARMPIAVRIANSGGHTVQDFANVRGQLFGVDGFVKDSTGGNR